MVTGDRIDNPDLPAHEASVVARHPHSRGRVAETPAGAALLSVGDFFVIDGEHAVRSHYDAGGSFLGAVAVGAADSDSYVALADLAWQLASPFTAWWAAHPQYHRATPAA